MSQDIHRVLADGYTLVRSIEENRSIASLTLDHLLQNHITSLKQGETQPVVDGQGATVGQRISRYDQLTQVQNSLDQAVQAIQDAGDDIHKLQSLGLFEIDQPTKSGDETSTSEGA